MTHEERLRAMSEVRGGVSIDDQRAAGRAGAEALRQNEIMRRALEQFADNGLSADNCASVEVAAGRVRAIARAVLLATEVTP